MLTVYNDYKKVNTAGGTAVAIGNFDGLHKGHQMMLKVLNSTAKELGVPSVAYTFFEHPVNILGKTSLGGQLLTNEEKVCLMEKENIHTLFFEDFDVVKDLSAEEFVKEILLDKLNIKAAVIGENGRFGKNGEGNAEKFKRLGERHGFLVKIVKSVKISDVVCSSTEIRNRIISGEVDKANEMLGRYYSQKGVVKKDKQLGRTYGYPTANITIDKASPKLKRGVYATNVLLDGLCRKAITNVGTTSFNSEENERIESHILDFSGDLYGKEIEVEFLYYMRDFKSFTDVDELRSQLDEDKKERKLGGK